MSERPVYFFGCTKGVRGDNQAGHYFYLEGLRDDRDWLGEETLPHPLPFPIDGGFCPGRSAGYGAAQVTHWAGWTCLGMWDSSGDTRPGSDSNFFCEGTLSFEEMLSEARRAFPEVVNRIESEYGEITLVNTVTASEQSGGEDG